jgi:hypothetical protein
MLSVVATCDKLDPTLWNNVTIITVIAPIDSIVFDIVTASTFYMFHTVHIIFLSLVIIFI